MNSILERIAERKAEEVASAKRKTPVSSLNLNTSLPIRDFVGALKANSPAIIAEIKKASPSKGLIRADFDVAEIATIYAQNGASCLSVLTDQDFFQGHPDYLSLAKSTCSLPVLRKDFIIDSYQVQESRFLGADCILLIVALLDDYQLMDYCQMAQELNMAVLVESHTREELNRAIKLPTSLIGINNRSLHTFKTDIQLSIQFKDMVPDNKIIITESGINSRDDINFMLSKGIRTFLIGESLMRVNDIGFALRSLIQN